MCFNAFKSWWRTWITDRKWKALIISYFQYHPGIADFVQTRQKYVLKLFKNLNLYFQMKTFHSMPIYWWLLFSKCKLKSNPQVLVMVIAYLYLLQIVLTALWKKLIRLISLCLTKNKIIWDSYWRISPVQSQVRVLLINLIKLTCKVWLNNFCTGKNKKIMQSVQIWRKKLNISKNVIRKLSPCGIL